MKSMRIIFTKHGELKFTPQGGRDMRIRYSRKEDILLIEVSDEPIDYAEEVGPIIVHFTKDENPVLLEILDASEFLAEATKVAMRQGEGEVEVSV
jgi:hypothetical protein